MPATEPPRVGRKRPLPACPNPLFLRWLTELRDEAREKRLKIQHTYQKAINSLNKYPLPLQSAKEAKILQNFGDGICKILDERLQRHLREEGPNAPIQPLPGGAPPAGRPDNNTRAPSRKEKKDIRGRPGRDGGGGGGRRKREYVPQKRSGGYAVLLTLHRHSQVAASKGFMFKMELQNEAQRLCDKSFAVPELGSKYTAWSSVSTLIQKNLLLKTHNPARYSLTEEGAELARRLAAAEDEGAEEEAARSEGEEEEKEEEEEEEEEEERVVDLTASDEEEERVRPSETACREEEEEEEEAEAEEEASSSETASRKLTGERLLPGSYEIILCVDFIETTGGAGHCKQELVKELQRNGVRFDIRKLNVGDFLWVAQEKVAPVSGQLRAPTGRELILDYIIERKRMDDLCGSIIDGRFREQKFRLKRCGLRRPIYLVEECGKAASHMSLPEATLQQAIVNTQVVDGFFVKRVQDVRESAAYLTVMTRYLTKLYQNQTLTCRSRELQGDELQDDELQDDGRIPACSLMSFAEFNYGAIKNKSQTVREVFARQLLQISGLSGDKAAAILEQYSTPLSLLTAYKECGSEAEKEKLLSSIRYGKLKRNLGPALSRTVYQLYCSPGALS